MFLSSGTGASIVPNVGRLVGWSVENFLHLKKSKFFDKNQSSLIIFDYLINFGVSLRIGTMEGGWGKRGFRGEGRLIIK